MIFLTGPANSKLQYGILKPASIHVIPSSSSSDQDHPKKDHPLLAIV